MSMIALTLTVCVVATSPPTYNVTRLEMPGGYAARAWGINNAGQIVGEYYLTDSFEYHAIRWQFGVAEDLHSGDGHFSAAFAINDNGTVVGRLVPGVNGGHIPVIFSGGSYIELETLSVPSGKAVDINEQGVIVGQVFHDGEQRAVLWTSGKIAVLEPYSGFWTGAVEINESGLVALITGFPYMKAAIWQNGHSKTLGTFDGVSSNSRAVNDSGVVVGGWQLVDGTMHAYRWTAESGMIDLGVVMPEFDNATIADINNEGDMIGIAWTGGLGAGILWHDGKAFDIGELVPAGNAPIVLRGINDAGQIIGEIWPHAVLLTPVDLGDLNDSGSVDQVDLALFLEAWILGGSGADLNHDERIDRLDLMLLLSNWSE